MNGSREGRTGIHFGNGMGVGSDKDWDRDGVRAGQGTGTRDAAGNGTGMRLRSAGVALRVVRELVATFTAALEVVAAVAG